MGKRKESNMSDVSMGMVEHAWTAYEKYIELPSSDKAVDFNSFAVGYFLGAVAAAGKRDKHVVRKGK